MRGDTVWVLCCVFFAGRVNAELHVLKYAVTIEVMDVAPPLPLGPGVGLTSPMC